MTRPTPRFLVKQWPDGAVVFDCMLGHTHALNAASTQLFLATCATPSLGAQAQAPSMQGMDDSDLQEAWQGLRAAGLLDTGP